MQRTLINGVHSLFKTYKIPIKYDFFLHYTTTSSIAAVANENPSKPIVEYLVNSLGFTHKQALDTSSKVNHFKSPDNPNSVVHFFKSCGFTQTHIINIVSTNPKILSCNVDKTLRPKIQAFVDLGLCGPDLAHVLAASPEVVWRSLDDHLVPTLNLLRSLFSGHDDFGNLLLIDALKRSAWFLGPGTRKQLPGVIELLQSYGFSGELIKKLALRKPRYFALGAKALEPLLIKVEKEIGIPRDSPMFFHGVVALSSASEANLELRKKLYMSYGWTEADVLTLARRNPYVLLISEVKLRKVLDYFMKELGYEAGVLACNPSVLSFRLEKRVMPRNEVLRVLKERKKLKKSYSLLSCLSKTEVHFFEKFVLPYKKEIPSLYEDYVKTVGLPLEADK